MSPLAVACVLLGLALPASAGVLRLPVKRMAREAAAAAGGGEVEQQQAFDALPLGALQSLAATSSALVASSGAEELFLGNQRNNAYFVEVQVGTPGQPLMLLLDTGSSNLWVPVKHQRPAQNGHHSFYDPAKSSSHVAMEKPFRISYGSGDVSGFYCQDHVVLGGMTLPNFTFAHVHRTGGLEGFRHAAFDGILGLGFQANSVDNVSTVVKELVLSGQLNEPIFAFYLGDRQSEQFILGGVDPAHFVGDFHFAELSRTFSWPGHWVVDLASVKVGRELALTATQHAVVDSGNSLISGPKREIHAVAAMIGAHRYGDVFAIKCNANVSLAFSVGGVDLVLELEDLVIARQGHLCQVGLEVQNIPAWVLGDVFLRKYYVQFDWGQKRMGFALAATKQNLI